MNKKQLRDLITRTLKAINCYSEEAVNLLMGTAAQESHLYKYIKQIKGPALGGFQMEPASFDDICNNYLKYKSGLRVLIMQECQVITLKPEMLEYNLKVAICFCRLQYRRYPESLPQSIEDMAKLWKKRYNTPLGKGTEHEFIDNYKRFVINT